MIIKSLAALCWCPNELFCPGHLCDCLRDLSPTPTDNAIVAAAVWQNTSSLVSGAQRPAERRRRNAAEFAPVSRWVFGPSRHGYQTDCHYIWDRRSWSPEDDL